MAVDLGDFDAVGIVGEIVHALRHHAIGAGLDAAATFDAPPGWHRLVVTARQSGHLVLSIRYAELSQSRWHNLSKALAMRGWLPDEDEDGATLRYPPGTEASTAAFEILAALPMAGAPAGVRTVAAVDGSGEGVTLPGPTPG